MQNQNHDMSPLNGSVSFTNDESRNAIVLNILPDDVSHTNLSFFNLSWKYLGY